MRAFFIFAPQVGGDQLSLEQTLGLGFGYPAVVAISGSKRRFAIQRDAFGEANIAKFVKDIVSGKQSTNAVEKWPDLKAVTVRFLSHACISLLFFVFCTQLYVISVTALGRQRRSSCSSRACIRSVNRDVTFYISASHSYLALTRYILIMALA
jgi:hypothetical protein